MVRHLHALPQTLTFPLRLSIFLVHVEKLGRFHLVIYGVEIENIRFVDSSELLSSSEQASKSNFC